MLFLCFNYSSINGQARLVLNGAYINANGGNATNSIYLVVENPNTNAITRNTGHFISSSEYNFIKWNMDTFIQVLHIFPKSWLLFH